MVQIGRELGQHAYTSQTLMYKQTDTETVITPSHVLSIHVFIYVKVKREQNL